MEGGGWGLCVVCVDEGEGIHGHKDKEIFQKCHTFFVRGECFEHSDKLQEHLQDGSPMASLEGKTLCITASGCIAMPGDTTALQASTHTSTYEHSPPTCLWSVYCSIKRGMMVAVMEAQAGSEARATACSILAAGRISRNSGSQRWRRQSVEKETRERLVFSALCS